ncbi:undecaprenyl-phosphate glucose phosphotransferase [Methylomagnum ishizawai]|uniref:undecaprenyl-phosphate glucose phosphotransferase n=1 Tax=Methylomagnum ishizawai TaxID=1760988 RepID=UPI001C7F82B1|nr:undecaprenyl-phosphate glucose phosphotransferase [Methylomagnum ishizawai]
MRKSGTLLRNTPPLRWRKGNQGTYTETQAGLEFLPSARLTKAPSHGATSLDLPGVILIKWLLCPVVVSLGLALVTLGHGHALDQSYVILGVLGFLVSAQVFDEINLYRDRPRFPYFEAINYILWNWCVVFGVLLLVGYATKTLAMFSHRIIFTWFVMVPIALLGSQLLARNALRSVVNRTKTRKAVIIAANPLGLALHKKVTEDAYLGIRVVGFFDDRQAWRLPENMEDRLLGRVAEAADYVRKHGVDLIYIALPMSLQPRIQHLLEALRDTTASVFFVPDIFIFDLIQARFSQINGMPIVAVCDTPFYGLRGLIKRAFDIIGSLAILLVISPVFIVVAIAVKLDSKGPVLFRQRRYGLDGEEVIVYKFRSMTVTEDGASNYTQVTQNDNRVTALGKFIRKTSLDELPQFINVLQGRMSLVGPRPHAIAVNEQYRKQILGYMIRHKVKPGITGWAQVNGFRGGDDLEHMRGRIECDLEYLRNWSLGLDCWIILKTIKVLFGDRHAY